MRLTRHVVCSTPPTSKHHVFADPAGHPFCIGWGDPDAAELRQFLGTLPPDAGE